MSEEQQATAAVASETEADEPSSDLKRRLGPRQMAMLALGSSLGTGLFLGSAEAIGTAGPAVIISFAVGAAIAAIVAMALGEMVTVHPVRGSFGPIAGRYLGPWAGFLIRWTYWAAIVCAIGSEVVAAAIYLRFWWPQLPLWLPIVLFTLLIGAVNLGNVRMFGSTEFGFAAIKVTAILVFLILGVIIIVVGLPGTPATGVDAWSSDGGFFPHGPQAIWLVMATVIFSFTGIELVAISAPEAKNPTRSIRIAMRSMIFRLSLFYVGAIAVTVAIVSWSQAQHSDSVEQSPFVTVFSTAGVPAAAAIMNAVVLTAALSAANANLYAASRMLHSLGHDGFALRGLRHTSRRGIPVPALVVSMVGLFVAAILAATGVAGVFAKLMAMASFCVIVVWAMMLASHLAFRHYRRGLPRQDGFRMPAGRVLATLGIVALLSVFGTAASVSSMRLACAIGAPFMVLLVVAYLVVRRRASPTPQPTDQDRQRAP